jgi:hypothetical protein
MKLRLGRIVLAAAAAEIAGVLALAALVAIFGPSGFKEAQPFAERLGAWVGPISGFLLCIGGGYWVAKGAAPYYLTNGVAMGLAGALVDIVSAIALGASFQILLVVSNVGRIVAGFVGGALASRSK